MLATFFRKFYDLKYKNGDRFLFYFIGSTWKEAIICCCSMLCVLNTCCPIFFIVYVLNGVSGR